MTTEGTQAHPADKRRPATKTRSTTQRVYLHFGADIADRPIIYRLVKDYDLVINILRANVNPQKEGTMVMAISGENCDEGIQYLKDRGVTVYPLTEAIRRSDYRCTMCGACTDICPTGALSIERPSMEVLFDQEKCVVCQACTTACPVRAMEVNF